MLNNSILEYKRNMTSKYLDEEIINLLSSNFVIPDVFTYQVVRVPKSMIARPDLLSKSLYDNASYGDLLCKLNGISNAFELNEDMVIVAPTENYIKMFFRDDTTDDTIGIDASRYAHASGRDLDLTSMKIHTNDVETSSEVVMNTGDKHTKRRPNQATSQDVRYRVDKNRRVVVY